MKILLSLDSFHHVFELWLNILWGTEQCLQSKETELWIGTVGPENKWDSVTRNGPNVLCCWFFSYFPPSPGSPFTFQGSYIVRSCVNSIRKHWTWNNWADYFQMYREQNEKIGICNLKTALFNFRRNKTLTFWLLLLSKVQFPPIMIWIT